jgi:hypothetical protein
MGQLARGPNSSDRACSMACRNDADCVRFCCLRLFGRRRFRGRFRRARNPRSPSPPPSPICRGSGMAVPSPTCRGSGVHPHRHPRFARVGQCLTFRNCTAKAYWSLRRPAMSDDAVDYSGTSDSDSESDKVSSRLPARAESCILAHDLSVLHAGFGCAPSSPE